MHVQPVGGPPAGWMVKNDAYVVNTSGMLCTSSGFYQGLTIDPFDPNAQTAATAIWSTTNVTGGPFFTSANIQGIRYYISDDGDNFFAGDSADPGYTNGHGDFGYVYLAQSPVQPSITANDAPGVPCNGGGNYTYTNQTLWEKLAFADYLGGEYGNYGTGVSVSSIVQPPSGYIVNVTTSAPHALVAGQMAVMRGASPSGFNNADRPFIVMAQGLDSTHFSYIVATANLGTGSGGTASPVLSSLVTSGTDTIGMPASTSGKIASALSALNIAWFGSQVYSTFGTSDPGGLTGIANGTYASWGTGTGFLDENGTNVLASSVKSSCTAIPAYGNCSGGTCGNTWGKNATLVADADNFLGYDIALIMFQERQGYQTAANIFNSGSGAPFCNMLYDAPNEVYQQSAAFLDCALVNPAWYPNVAAEVNRMQTIVNNFGGKPVINVDYSIAPKDSSMGSDCTTLENTAGVPPLVCYSTEAQRASSYSIPLWQGILPLQNQSLGLYEVVGLSHWMWSDWDNESSNGIVTLSDNQYDGSEASTLSGSSGAWAASHTYAMPTRITDSNGNYETLSITTASCTSGGSAPTWKTLYGQMTTDGSGSTTCYWFNRKTYPITAEANNYGNYILPVSQFLNAGICDPASSP